MFHVEHPEPKKTIAKTRRERKNLKKSNGGSKICECGAVFAQNYKESGSKSRADVIY